MSNLFKAFKKLTSYSECRRIRTSVFRIFTFKLFKAAKQRIVFSVGNYRVVIDIIFSAVKRKTLCELVNFLFYTFGRCCVFFICHTLDLSFSQIVRYFLIRPGPRKDKPSTGFLHVLKRMQNFFSAQVILLTKESDNDIIETIIAIKGLYYTF